MKELLTHILLLPVYGVAAAALWAAGTVIWQAQVPWWALLLSFYFTALWLFALTR